MAVEKLSEQQVAQELAEINQALAEDKQWQVVDGKLCPGNPEPPLGHAGPQFELALLQAGTIQQELSRRLVGNAARKGNFPVGHGGGKPVWRGHRRQGDIGKRCEHREHLSGAAARHR